jgi:hypothetical protein
MIEGDPMSNQDERDAQRQARHDERAAADEKAKQDKAQAEAAAEAQRASTRAALAERREGVDKLASEVEHDQVIADINTILDSGEPDPKVMIAKIAKRIRAPKP